MKAFVVRIDEDDLEVLDRRRGKLGRGQYLIELMRRMDLRTVEADEAVNKLSKKMEQNIVTMDIDKKYFKPTEGPFLRKILPQAKQAKRPKSLEEEMLGI